MIKIEVPEAAYMKEAGKEKELQMLPSKEEMALTIDEADWSCLRAHLNRGGLILVDDSLDLADTALKVAADDIAIIQHLLEIGMIGKPSESKIRSWEENVNKKFSMLIVSPYVLFQEKTLTFH
ncbi:MAG: DUF2288 domain-containing protein [Desulfuromonadaceae bacterium]